VYAGSSPRPIACACAYEGHICSGRRRSHAIVATGTVTVDIVVVVDVVVVVVVVIAGVVVVVVVGDVAALCAARERSLSPPF
jgi:hypothetical protein